MPKLVQQSRAYPMMHRGARHKEESPAIGIGVGCHVGQPPFPHLSSRVEPAYITEAAQKSREGCDLPFTIVVVQDRKRVLSVENLA